MVILLHIKAIVNHTLIIGYRKNQLPNDLNNDVRLTENRGVHNFCFI